MAVAIAVAVVVILFVGSWVTRGRGDRHDVTRWSKGGDLQETEAFAKAVNHMEDRGQWLTGAREPGSPVKEPGSDYSLPRVSVYSVPSVQATHPRPTFVDIVGADDVSPFVWRVQLVPNRMNPDNGWVGRRALNARFKNTGSWRQLVFSDYGRAVKLTHWVRTHAGERLSGYEFNWSVGTGLAVIKQTQDECVETSARPQPEPDTED
jgi:hypothetical protein